MKILKIVRSAFYIIVSIISVVVLIYIGIYIYALATPKFDIKKVNRLYMYDMNNNLLNISGNTDNWVKLENISKNLIDATIVSEDQKFYHHIGFDYLRIGIVALNNIISGENGAGASTITQQYARNIFSNFDKTWQRKFDEAILTIELETHFTKNEILEGYLNTINYGGVFGIGNASKYYFDKEASELTLAEASILSGIPKSPSNYSPLKNEENAKKRQKIILNMMYNNNVISLEEKEQALNEVLVYVGQIKEYNSTTIDYYKDAVLKELKTVLNVDDNFFKEEGIKIYTNFDPLAQENLEKSIEKNLKNSPLQVSAVLADSATGAVRGLVGGRDYSMSQFNRALDSKRQVGSTMKPFLYYAALENGFTSSSTFLSEPTTFTFSSNKTYSPVNYGDKYSPTPISLATALAYSDNIYAVKTHLFLGQDVLIDTAKRLGITSNLEKVPSLPLGTNGISILEMVGAYSAFASMGNKVEPYFITKIEDISGNTLYEYKQEDIYILNKNITFILNELLANTYNKNFIDYNYPTCLSIAPILSKKYSIKTGTTNTDIWSIGYNPDVIVAVWAGYDDNKSLQPKEYDYAKYIWANSIEGYLKGSEGKWYDIPPNVSGVMVNPISGKVSNNPTDKKTMLYYIKGTEPYFKSEDLESVFKETHDNN